MAKVNKQPLTKQEIMDKHWTEFVDLVEHDSRYSRFKSWGGINESKFWEWYDYEYVHGWLASNPTDPGVEYESN